MLCCRTHVLRIGSEVSILGPYVRAPANGAIEALRRVTRYLLGTKGAHIKRSAQSGDPSLVDMDFSDSDWAGDPASRKSQSSGHVDADGCPMASFSLRQSCVATSSGMAEYCATCSTAEEPLHLRSVMEQFEFKVNTTIFCDCVAARGIAQSALMEKTLWLQEIVRDRGLQNKAVSSKANTRLNALRAACGIVVPGEPACEHVDEGGTDG